MPKRSHNRRSKSKSGYFGVYYKISSGKYQAMIRFDGKTKTMGSSYDTAKQAAKAYDKEVIRLRCKPLSKLNYPNKAPVGYTPKQKTLMSTNTVGYRGVYKSGKKFKAMIWIGGKSTYFGTYDTSKEAAIAYDRAVLKANKSTTLLNFPDMVHNLDVEPKRKKYKRSSTGYRGVNKNTKGKSFNFPLIVAIALNFFPFLDTPLYPVDERLYFLRFGSTSRLCTMSGKFNKVVDLLALRTARS